MPNQFGLNNAQAQKPTRWAPIFTSRFFSGLWTNRSPLRDATTTRIVEKFYGAAGDALIAGSNVEISNKLTLNRRPGTSIFDSNIWGGIDRFYVDRIFNSTEEIIKLIVDGAEIYQLYQGVKSTIFTKGVGAGQGYFQSVGNTLYFSDGVDQKKLLQSLVTWTANVTYNPAQYPFFTTYLIDPNGNVQQLIGTAIAFNGLNITANLLTVTSGETLTGTVNVGDIYQFPSPVASPFGFLANQYVTVLTVSANSFTAYYAAPDTSGAASGVLSGVNQGVPVAGATMPAWSTVVPDAGNFYQGGETIDGTALWVNRGLPTENWGIVAGTKPIVPQVLGAASAWASAMSYSLGNVIVDSNGNLQVVAVAGTSGGTALFGLL